MKSNSYHRRLKLSRVSSPTFDEFLLNKLKPNKDEKDRKSTNEEGNNSRV